MMTLIFETLVSGSLKPWKQLVSVTDLVFPPTARGRCFKRKRWHKRSSASSGWFPSPLFSSCLVTKPRWLLLSGRGSWPVCFGGGPEVKGHRANKGWGFSGVLGGAASKGLNGPLNLRVPLLHWQMLVDVNDRQEAWRRRRRRAGGSEMINK